MQDDERTYSLRQRSSKQSRWEVSLQCPRSCSFAASRANAGNMSRAPHSNCRLAHPINHTFGSVRHRLVSFRQKFGQNRKVLHWILRTFRVGLNIDNVGRRMPGKILLEDGPGAGQDPAASIETRDRSAEDITRERKRCDVTSRQDVCERLDRFPKTLTPDENSVVRARMRRQISSRFRRHAPRSQPCPVFD